MKSAVPRGAHGMVLCVSLCTHYANIIEAEIWMRIYRYVDDITITEQMKHGR